MVLSAEKRLVVCSLDGWVASDACIADRLRLSLELTADVH